MIARKKWYSFIKSRLCCGISKRNSSSVQYTCFSILVPHQQSISKRFHAVNFTNHVCMSKGELLQASHSWWAWSNSRHRLAWNFQGQKMWIGLGALLLPTSFEALQSLSPSTHEGLLETQQTYTGSLEQKLHLSAIFLVWTPGNQPPTVFPFFPLHMDDTAHLSS